MVNAPPGSGQSSMLCWRPMLVKNSAGSGRGKPAVLPICCHNRHDPSGGRLGREVLEPGGLVYLAEHAASSYSPPPAGRLCRESVYMTVITPDANRLQGIQSLVLTSRFIRV